MGSVGAALFLAAGLAACGTNESLPGTRELEALPADAEKTEVLEALPFGPLGAEERGQLWGYRRSVYLVDGTTVEVLWVGPPAGAAPGTPHRESYNPVIFLNNRLDGWGWAHYDERREAWSLPDPDAPPTPPNSVGDSAIAGSVARAPRS